MIGVGDRVRVVSAVKFKDCIGHTGVVTAIRFGDNLGLVFDEPKPLSAARLSDNRAYPDHELAFAPHRLVRVGDEEIVVC